MDIFTPRSDLDLSVNFNANTDDRYTRKEKISVIRKFSKVLYSHQSISLNRVFSDCMPMDLYEYTHPFLIRSIQGMEFAVGFYLL